MIMMMTSMIIVPSGLCSAILRAADPPCRRVTYLACVHNAFHVFSISGSRKDRQQQSCCQYTGETHAFDLQETALSTVVFIF